MPRKRNKAKAGKAKGNKERKAKAKEMKVEKGREEDEMEEVKHEKEEETGKKSSGSGDAINQQEGISLAQELSRMMLVDVPKLGGKKEASQDNQAFLAEILSEMPEEEQRSISRVVRGAIAEKRDAEKRAAMSALGFSDEQQALLDNLFANDESKRDHLNKLVIRDAKLRADAMVAAQQLEQTFTNPSKIVCMHGFHNCPYNGAYGIIKSFFKELIAGKDQGDVTRALLATMSKYAKFWCCIPTITAVQSYFLWLGTERVLTEKEYTPNMCAYVVRIIEQMIEWLRAGDFEGDWDKILNVFLAKAYDLITANDRALISFFRRRIPCKCLEEKHEENKGQTKTSICYNTKCTFYHFERVEKSKTMCCSRCRTVNYCSRECQVADWSRHKPYCQKIQTDK